METVPLAHAEAQFVGKRVTMLALADRRNLLLKSRSPAAPRPRAQIPGACSGSCPASCAANKAVASYSRVKFFR
jgi:hypothetical protein